MVLFILVTMIFANHNPSVAQAGMTENRSLYIEIVVEECKLFFYEYIADKGFILIGTYSVASFKQGLPEYPLGLGYATKVDFNPNWQPTRNTVSYMNRQLQKTGKKRLYHEGETIPSGDPRNAMGRFKIHLSHTTPINGNIYRIHGTNNPGSIGKRASGGCTRMDDSDPRVMDFATKISDAINSNVPVIVNILLERPSA